MFFKQNECIFNVYTVKYLKCCIKKKNSVQNFSLNFKYLYGQWSFGIMTLKWMHLSLDENWQENKDSCSSLLTLLAIFMG